MVQVPTRRKDSVCLESLTPSLPHSLSLSLSPTYILSCLPFSSSSLLLLPLSPPPSSPQAAAIIESHRPPPNWPAEGHVQFDHYSTRYREGLNLVLRDISVDIPGGTKVNNSSYFIFPMELLLLFLYCHYLTLCRLVLWAALGQASHPSLWHCSASLRQPAEP